MKIAGLKTTGAFAPVLLVIAAGLIGMQAAAGSLSSNATLSGRVIYADGRPASGVRVVGQMQGQAELDLSQKLPPLDWANCDSFSDVTKPDGSYRLQVPPHLPYNILVNMAKPPKEDDRNAQWVAAAKEGAVGRADKNTSLPALVLTKGVVVTGFVTDQASGLPLSGVYVGSHGPARPATTAMILNTVTDKAGQYCLRVMPGSNTVYIADGRYNGMSDEKAKVKGLTKTVIATKGQAARADFIVGPALTAPEIAARCRAAYSALASYQGTTSVSTRSVIAGRRTHTYHTSANIQFVRPGKIRVAGTDHGYPFAYVSDGVGTAEQDGFGKGVWEKAANAEMALAGTNAATTVPALLLGTGWGNPFFTRNFGAVVREDDVEGKPCYVISDFLMSGKGAMRLGSVMALTGTFWVDKQTFLLRRYVQTSDSPAQTRVIAGDKRHMPAVNLHHDQRFTNERLNETIPNSIFKVPVTH